MLGKLSKLVVKRFKSLMNQPAATVEYPYVVRHAPHNARVSLRNNFSECIGCRKCEEICPAACIDIATEPYPSKEKAPKTSKGLVFEARVSSFKIDFSTCVNCGLCVEFCPTGSLTNDKNFVAPRQDRRHLTLDLVHRPRTLRRDQGYEE
jgi:formate hydrogenlyase subunit 6/NADH:ubiquinone oxidoreductase subunit I